MLSVLYGRHIARKQVNATTPPIVAKFADWDTAFDETLNALADGYAMSEKGMTTLQKIVDGYSRTISGKLMSFVSQNITDIIAKAARDGSGAAGATTAIESYLASSGLTSSKPWLAETVSRTITNVGYGAGEQAAYRDTDIASEIWGYRYVATEDDRTRPEHAAFDGVTLPKDAPFWKSHWPGAWDYNCRCTHEIILADENHRIVSAPDDADEFDGIGLNIRDVARALAA